MVKDWKPVLKNKTTVYIFSTYIINIVLEVLAKAIKQEIKGIRTRKETVKVSFFEDNSILYAENSENSIKKVL